MFQNPPPVVVLEKKKYIYKGVVIICCEWVYKCLPALPTFGTVVSRGRTNATPHPLTKLELGVGIELRSRVATRGRNHVTTAVNPCCNWYDFGYSYPRHQAALSQYCDSSVFLKYATFRTSMHNLETSVTIVITTTNRCRPTCRGSSVLTTYRMPAGFCGLNPIRAGSCKNSGGQLGKVPNKLRQQAR